MDKKKNEQKKITPQKDSLLKEIDLDEAEQVKGGTMRDNVVFTERVTFEDIKK